MKKNLGDRIGSFLAWFLIVLVFIYLLMVMYWSSQGISSYETNKRITQLEQGNFRLIE